ncbi:hypothetical protein QFC21_005588 [Naganishia friedmannii]|uniref:Uncharacterized protein n=1 Tax=Naganishia friedmannii TaxID=89922 RepID=A0ACC2VA32_9TREE|nr:hypothetical protein QFC21_005588 [Naganishia friedmannii]
MRQGPPAVEFSSISPVSSMLAVAFWIKSDRFLLDGNLRKYKKEKLWNVWRTSTHYRQHGDDGPSKSDVKRLLQTWVERVRPNTTFLTMRELLALTATSMTNRARVAERQDKIHGGDWTAPFLLRSIAPAFIKLKLDLLVIDQQGKRPSGEDGEKFASAEICKRFSACAIKAGLRRYGVAIKLYIDALRQ